MSNIRKLWYLHKVMKQQWLKTSELEEIQRKMLRKIVKHAYENVPFYHQKFRSVGIISDDIKTVDDLKKIPITTKQELRDNFPESIVAKGVDINKCWTPHTGGSTGIPLTVVYDKKAEDYEKAIALRPNLCCGQKIRDKWVNITNPAHIHPKKWFQHFGIFSPINISTFLDAKEHISFIEKINPVVLSGFSSSLWLLAKEIDGTGNDRIHPRLIFGDAEFLDEDMRKFINSTFGVELCDLFGCVELARTAWECPEHCGYHIDMDAVVMEFIKDGEQVALGEKGEIVYTSLYNYAMPLIRYAIGDIGVPSDEKCSCGRGLPLMKIVEGRKDDFIVSQDDKIISPRVFSDLMKRISGIGQYKIIQENKEKIVIQMVKGDNFSPGTIEHINEEFKNVLGENIVIEIKIKEAIPKEPSGKLRKVISKVNIKF